jgi:hypothetical protein
MTSGVFTHTQTRFEEPHRLAAGKHFARGTVPERPKPFLRRTGLGGYGPVTALPMGSGWHSPKFLLLPQRHKKNGTLHPVFHAKNIKQ